MRLCLRAFGFAAFGLAALTGQASAHAHLKSAIPPMNGTVTAAPSELDLTFSEGLNLKFTGVKIAGPGQASVATGPAHLGPGGDTMLVVPVADSLTAGTYTVAWHAFATDGHKTSGSYTFTVRP